MHSHAWHLRPGCQCHVLGWFISCIFILKERRDPTIVDMSPIWLLFQYIIWLLAFYIFDRTWLIIHLFKVILEGHPTGFRLLCICVIWVSKSDVKMTFLAWGKHTLEIFLSYLDHMHMSQKPGGRLPSQCLARNALYPEIPVKREGNFLLQGSLYPVKITQLLFPLIIRPLP